MFPRARSPFADLRWPAIAALTRRILILISDSVARSASFRDLSSKLMRALLKTAGAIGIASLLIRSPIPRWDKLINYR
jgi:hypothetical protein